METGVGEFALVLRFRALPWTAASVWCCGFAHCHGPSPELCGARLGPASAVFSPGRFCIVFPC